MISSKPPHKQSATLRCRSGPLHSAIYNHVGLKSFIPQVSGAIFGKVYPTAGVKMPGRTGFRRMWHRMPASLYLGLLGDIAASVL
jgi:hypothetical protein